MLGGPASGSAVKASVEPSSVDSGIEITRGPDSSIVATSLGPQQWMPTATSGAQTRLRRSSESLCASAGDSPSRSMVIVRSAIGSPGSSQTVP